MIVEIFALCMSKILISFYLATVKMPIDTALFLGGIKKRLAVFALIFLCNKPEFVYKLLSA